MAGDSFVFRGTEMILRLTTEETGGHYALIEMRHAPSAGPALHVHPRGPESFYVLEGTYTFTRGGETITAGAGDAVTIPAGIPHRYVVGSQGGRVLVVTPPELERYFLRVAERMREGPILLDEEFAIAAACGQDFLSREGHWSD